MKYYTMKLVKMDRRIKMSKNKKKRKKNVMMTGLPKHTNDPKRS